MTDQPRNDMQVDALVRRLDVEQQPPRDFVDETYTLIRAHADEARRHDTSVVGRLQAALPLPARRAWQPVGWRPIAWRPGVALLLALLAVLVWLALSVTGPGSTPPRLTDHVLFGRGHPGTEGYDLWVATKGGAEVHLLVAGQNEPSRVSPDGTRVATPFHGALVFPRIYRTNGTVLTDLHPDPTLNLGVMAWSHNQQLFAAEGWDDTNLDRNGLYLMRTDGTGLIRLTGPGVPGDFSLDDRQVVLSRQEGLFIVNVDGTNEHQIGTLKPVGYSPPGYMPDGRSIYAAGAGKLWIVDVATGAARSIELPGGGINVPRLSPDGREFVFSFDADTADTTAIWVMNVDGTGAHEVADDPSVGEDFSDWLR